MALPLTATESFGRLAGHCAPRIDVATLCALTATEWS